MSSKRTPFFDWAGLYAERADEFRRITHETSQRGGFILQRDVEEFEKNIAKLIGVKHVVGLSDCTNAMLLGLRASGFGKDDEVIIPSHSFIAAAQAIHFAGAVPIPIELSELDWLMDVDAIEAAITPKTRAIMPVHVNGRICQMDVIDKIARRHNLHIIEDAAQALGASINGRSAGSFGLWGVFSFYPSKTLGCFGDAGALVTNDDTICDKVRRMRNHGADSTKSIPKDCNIWGTNSRLDNIHAAILNYKLTYYESTILRRREIAARYNAAFNHIKSLKLPPAPDADTRHFDIFQNYEICSNDRDNLRSFLADQEIGTIIQWGGVALHQFQELGFTQNLPKTDLFFKNSLLLPMNHILTDDQVDHVIDSVCTFYTNS